MPIPVKDIPGLLSITFYESTSGVMEFTFAVDGPELNNILADPLVELARGLSRGLTAGGTLVLSGLLTPQAPRVIAAYRAAGLVLRAHRRIAGWSTLVLVNRSPRGAPRR